MTDKFRDQGAANAPGGNGGYSRMLKIAWMKVYAPGQFTQFRQELRDYEQAYGKVPVIRVSDYPEHRSRFEGR
ncbi:MAG: hypothetical protein K8U57_37140 [Planctomycetes bacterium]|nr:hypothetical protein [Planctomycetota bacterium]